MGTRPLHEGILDDWERMIDTNIKGLLYVTREVAPIMIRRGRGHILNIASIAGKGSTREATSIAPRNTPWTPSPAGCAWTWCRAASR